MKLSFNFNKTFSSLAPSSVSIATQRQWLPYLSVTRNWMAHFYQHRKFCGTAWRSSSHQVTPTNQQWTMSLHSLTDTHSTGGVNVARSILVTRPQSFRHVSCGEKTHSGSTKGERSGVPSGSQIITESCTRGKC